MSLTKSELIEKNRYELQISVDKFGNVVLYLCYKKAFITFGGGHESNSSG